MIEDLEGFFSDRVLCKVVNGAGGERQQEANAINDGTDHSLIVAVKRGEAWEQRERGKAKKHPGCVRNSIYNFLVTGIALHTGITIQRFFWLRGSPGFMQRSRQPLALEY